MSLINYIIFRFFVELFRILPFSFIYILSNFFAFILCYIVKYRYKVIYENLKKSLPEKNEFELKSLIFPIYKNITDIMVETMKGFTISATTLQKRIKTVNEEIMEDLYNKYNGIIGVLGHYGNWEWAGLLAGLKLKQKTVALYKPLSNKYLDNYIRKNRSRFGIELCPIYITASTFEKYENKKVFYALIADQSPSNINKAIWIKFLKQDTACLQGPEKYARKFNMPVVYVHIERFKRGYYNITFKILTEKPKETNEGEITLLYMQTLEQYIHQNPTHWLWSHRRWKHKKTN
jgi:KDO2-lipid IV(A) lauroyltransferase